MDTCLILKQIYVHLKNINKGKHLVIMHINFGEGGGGGIGLEASTVKTFYAM